MQQEEKQKLVEKYFRNTASFEERQKLHEFYHSQNLNDVEWDFLNEEDEDALQSRIYEEIKAKTVDVTEKSNPQLWTWVGIAASFLVIILAGLYYYPGKPTEVLIAKEPIIVEDILPGGNKAILTLSDGSKIVLDDKKNGILTEQDGVTVAKAADGQLVYTFTGKKKHVNALYNAIETPVGGQYQVNLPDGSKVWLNSSSLLRFPALFSGNTREVELRGEAYFEIAADQTMPFIVNSGNQSVKVLGTHFNINAYTDEPSINTTLLEGSVLVSELGNNRSVFLKPGEQSIITDDIRVVKVDIQTAVAWKDGFFQFNGADIGTIMRQLGRWYGISVRHEGKISQQKYDGAINRKLTLLQALELLEKSQIHSKLEGREVIVMP